MYGDMEPNYTIDVLSIRLTPLKVVNVLASLSIEAHFKKKLRWPNKCIFSRPCSGKEDMDKKFPPLLPAFSRL